MSFGADFVTKKRGGDVEMGLGGAAASKEGDGGFELFLTDVDVVDSLVDEIRDIAVKITTLGRGFKQVGGFSSDKKKRTADYKELRQTGDAKVKALRSKQNSLKAKQTAAPPAAAARMRPIVYLEDEEGDQGPRRAEPRESDGARSARARNEPHARNRCAGR